MKLNGYFAQTCLHNDIQSSYYTAKYCAKQAGIRHRIPSGKEWRDHVGKSVILKDRDHRLMGYVRTVDGGVVCRAQLDASAELAILFSDGTQNTFALDGMREQQFSCEGKQLRGCYVFRGDVLLFASDETMHREFDRHVRFVQKKEEACAGQMDDLQKQEECPEDRQEEKLEREKKDSSLPQRRWPPPPCWETACYGDGCWQEQQSTAFACEESCARR